jgi:hypothetical protein
MQYIPQKPRVTQLVKKFPTLMKAEDLLLCILEPTTGSCPEPLKFSLHPQTPSSSEVDNLISFKITVCIGDALRCDPYIFCY